MTVSGFIFDLSAKLRWADTHLQHFQSLVGHHAETRPNTVSKHDDVLNGLHVRRLHISGINIDLPLHLGVFIYSLRSTLDHIAWRLCRQTMAEPPTEIMFPIHASNNAQSETRFLRRTQGMPPAAVQLIRDLQPYQRGTDYKSDRLWQLNELSNIDKHRIFAAHSSAASVYVYPGGYVQEEKGFGIEFRWPIAARDFVVVEPYTAELLFGKPMDLPGEPFEIRVKDIVDINRYVRDQVVPMFLPFFS